MSNAVGLVFPAATKLRPDKVPQAITASHKNGADDVFIKAGTDTFVYTQSGLDLKDVKVGDPVRFGEQTGTVLAVDKQIDAPKDLGAALPSLAVTTGVLCGAGRLADMVASHNTNLWAATLDVPFTTAFLYNMPKSGLAVAGTALFGAAIATALVVGIVNRPVDSDWADKYAAP